MAPAQVVDDVDGECDHKTARMRKAIIIGRLPKTATELDQV